MIRKFQHLPLPIPRHLLAQEPTQFLKSHANAKFQELPPALLQLPHPLLMFLPPHFPRLLEIILPIHAPIRVSEAPVGIDRVVRVGGHSGETPRLGGPEGAAHGGLPGVEGAGGVDYVGGGVGGGELCGEEGGGDVGCAL